MKKNKVVVVEDWVGYDEAIAQWRKKVPAGPIPHVKYMLDNWIKTTKIVGVSDEQSSISIH